MDTKTGMLLVCRKEFTKQVPLAKIWSIVTGDSCLKRAYIHNIDSPKIHLYQYSTSRPLFYIDYEPFYLTVNYIRAIVDILESCQKVIFIANPLEKCNEFDITFPITYANEIGIEVECRLESEFIETTEEQET